MNSKSKRQTQSLHAVPKPSRVAATASALSPVPLTLKEKNVLEFLELFIREQGISPSYQEICQNFGFASLNSVQRYLKQLEEKGYVQLPGGNQKRAISILKPASALQETLQKITQDNASTPTERLLRVPDRVHSEVINLPLLGRVAAGSPIEAYEHDEFIDVPASLVRNAERTYALRVQGQSMIEDGILDGDVILVQKQPHALNGDIVVAVVGEEATVKRFYTHRQKDGPQNKMIELRPANSSMTSMWFSESEVEIRGIVVGLIRKF